MGSVSGYEKCAQCGGMMHFTHYYRSGEYESLCTRCGKICSNMLKRDENCAIVRSNIYYPLDGSVVLGQMKSYSGSAEVVDPVRLTERITMPELRERVVYGYENIFLEKDGAPEPLFSIGDDLEITMDQKGKPALCIHKAGWERKDEFGYGFFVLYSDVQAEERFCRVPSLADAAAIEDIQRIFREAMHIRQSNSYATVWNFDLNRLVCIVGKMPPRYDAVH